MHSDLLNNLKRTEMFINTITLRLSSSENTKPDVSAEKVPLPDGVIGAPPPPPLRIQSCALYYSLYRRLLVSPVRREGPAFRKGPEA